MNLFLVVCADGKDFQGVYIICHEFNIAGQRALAKMKELGWPHNKIKSIAMIASEDEYATDGILIV